MTHIINDFSNFDSMTDKDDEFQLQEKYTVENCERKRELFLFETWISNHFKK